MDTYQKLIPKDSVLPFFKVQNYTVVRVITFDDWELRGLKKISFGIKEQNVSQKCVVGLREYSEQMADVDSLGGQEMDSLDKMKMLRRREARWVAWKSQWQMIMNLKDRG